MDWLVPSHPSPLALFLAASLLEMLFSVLYLFAYNSSHFAFSALFLEIYQLCFLIFYCFSEGRNHVSEPNCLFWLSGRSLFKACWVFLSFFFNVYNILSNICEHVNWSIFRGRFT